MTEVEQPVDITTASSPSWASRLSFSTDESVGGHDSDGIFSPSPIWEDRVAAEAEACRMVHDAERACSTPSPILIKAQVEHEQHLVLSSIRAENQRLRAQLLHEQQNSEQQTEQIDSLRKKMHSTDSEMRVLKQYVGELMGRIEVRTSLHEEFQDKKANHKQATLLAAQVEELDARFEKQGAQMKDLRDRCDETNKKRHHWEEQARLWEREVSETNKNVQYWLEKCTTQEEEVSQQNEAFKVAHEELLLVRNDLASAQGHLRQLQDEQRNRRNHHEQAMQSVSGMRNDRIAGFHKEAEGLRASITKARKDMIMTRDKFRTDQQILGQEVQKAQDESLRMETDLKAIQTANDDIRSQLEGKIQEAAKNMKIMQEKLSDVKDDAERALKQNEETEQKCTALELKYEKMIADKKLSSDLSHKINGHKTQLADIVLVNEESQANVDTLKAKLANLKQQLAKREAEAAAQITTAERKQQDFKKAESPTILKKVEKSKELKKVQYRFRVSLGKWRCTYCSLQHQLAHWVDLVMSAEKFDHWMETKNQRMGKYKNLIQRCVAKIILEKRTKDNIWKKMLSKAKDKGLDQFKKSVTEGIELIEKTEQKREAERSSQQQNIEDKLVKKRLAKKMARDRKRVLEEHGVTDQPTYTKSKKWRLAGWKMIEEKRNAKFGWLKLAKTLKGRGADERQKIVDDLKEAERARTEQLENERDRQQTIMRTKIQEKKKAKQVAKTVRKMVVMGGGSVIARPTSP
eukprot:TRINITY_DN53848_c0_g1_i1.p1 TRINITY_DN53848_c0_g1~~TRINITY_DN53848_c0_g1_i1.p1  ORF type:complete len:747 (+),score=155.65 TRINITY_DN53848_c0_g1_i1:62-2302(+)